MIKKIIILSVLLTTEISNAQSIIGKWKTIDDETGQEKSIVEIYKENDKYFGVVRKLLLKPQDTKCEKCTGEEKDKLVVGMVIVKNLVQDGNEFEDGTILDPKNGKIYSCKIWLDEKDNNILNVRGYVAFFFRTQKWYKFKE